MVRQLRATGVVGVVVMVAALATAGVVGWPWWSWPAVPVVVWAPVVTAVWPTQVFEYARLGGISPTWSPATQAAMRVLPVSWTALMALGGVGVGVVWSGWVPVPVAAAGGMVFFAAMTYPVWARRVGLVEGSR